MSGAPAGIDHKCLQLVEGGSLIHSQESAVKLVISGVVSSVGEDLGAGGMCNPGGPRERGGGLEPGLFSYYDIHCWGDVGLGGNVKYMKAGSILGVWCIFWVGTVVAGGGKGRGWAN